MTTPLRISFVPGVTIGKWTTRWEERRPETPLEFVAATEAEQVGVVTGGRVDVGFVRLPIARDGLSVIRLYGEIAVAVVPAEDPIADAGAATLADLEGRTLHDADAPLRDTMELIAAGVGAIVLPHSVARLYSRKGVVAVPVTDAPETEIAIVWLADATTPDIEEFVGIVRGRGANSSRQTPTPPKERPIRVVEPRKPRPSRPQQRRRQGR